MRYLLALFLFAILSGQETNAQEYAPAIIPERLQQLASEFAIGKQLGFSWDTADPDATGRYMGFLAATNEIAKEIAARNNQDPASPTDEDYLAGFSVLCAFPWNKPGVVAEYRTKLYPAYYSEDVRKALHSAVGDVAVSLPPYFKGATVEATYAGVGLDKVFPEVLKHILDRS